MFSDEAIETARHIITALGLERTIIHISNGELLLTETPSCENYFNLKHQLEAAGFELLHSRKLLRVEQIKYVLDQMITEDKVPFESHSRYIKSRIPLNYNYLANLFMEINGITIEKYIINLKIEKAKSLFLIENYSINEVAKKLNYSSPAHLSNQFKKITGINPSYFKKQANKI
jgi:transcriptional regulator GlxA family with amidase domain